MLESKAAVYDLSEIRRCETGSACIMAVVKKWGIHREIAKGIFLENLE